MTLFQTYKKERGLRLNDIATGLNVSQAHASRIVSGNFRSLPRSIVHGVYELTHGAIDANALFGIQATASANKTHTLTQFQTSNHAACAAVPIVAEAERGDNGKQSEVLE